ncbi:endonuclease/exonuclease/phosphatase family protein, partial [Candidatus Poribacteria bacterium]|nr:endonuclease/exonuclease/phosphatase family protein [Candidatus Poribacteria bacterium]
MWVIIICIVSLTPGVSFSQSITEISFATWNVENLFDDSDDSGTHDNEVMTWWNTKLYQNQLTRLAEIITQMNSGRGPDILALVEVENAKVITDLVRKLPAPTSYTIVHIEGEASRGIEVGLITRFPVLAQSSHFVWEGLRDILRVDLDVYGKPLTVLVVHWKSRVGGTFETADLRTLCAARTYQLYREIVRENESADVIICGDFNDTQQTISITDVLNAKASVEKIQRQRQRKYLYNGTTELWGKSPGTHFYDH